jgi:hypothetical protein
MNWEKLLKVDNVPDTRVNAKDEIIKHYAMTKTLMDEILKQILEIDFDNPDEALTKWDLVMGGLKDLEGASIGFKEVHDNMTRVLEGA